MAEVLTPKELAQECDTDPKTMRKYLRATVRAAGIDNPGKGHRWEIARKDVRKIKKDFLAWNEARTAPAPEVDEDEVEVEVTED